MEKTISFGIPCYNSAEYMDRCIESILKGSGRADDIEIIIVDDGSTKDDTGKKADEWQERYPNIIRAIHQQNGGHGMAVLAALHAARGAYFKVVDSDDWLDVEALGTLLAKLRSFIHAGDVVDLVISNYVYEHTEDNTQNFVDYRYAISRNKIMGWDDIIHIKMTQSLLMHALCYRTAVLLDGDIPMPAHTFYVDNIYAFVPLPRCKTLYYLDVDLYRYFIGREDQSVNESVMVSRVDQQFRVTRIMMRSYHLYKDIPSTKLRTYMVNYFVIMMAVCSIFSKLSGDPAILNECDDVWEELKAYDKRLYRRCRMGVVGIMTNLPTKTGEKATIGIYRFIQKCVKFN